MGMSIAVLLPQNNDMVVLDVDPSRVEKINKRHSIVVESQIEDFLL